METVSADLIFMKGRRGIGELCESGSGIKSGGGRVYKKFYTGNLSISGIILSFSSSRLSESNGYFSREEDVPYK